jgi:acetolactate synthase-1/3 small subunit
LLRNHEARAIPAAISTPAAAAATQTARRSRAKDDTPMLAEPDRTETHTLSILVDNEPGVLARVIGLFSGRGYNIDSLTVSEVSHETQRSRITIVTTGAPMVIEQIKSQLDRLVPVHSVADLTVEGRAVERELALIKVRGKGEDRVEALRMADAFRARIVDTTTESFIFELTGKPDKIDQFVLLMKPIGLVEVSRTGVAAIGRGPEGTDR